jgi:hypothetical protein
MLTCCNLGTKRVVENNIQMDSLVVNQTYHMLGVETNPCCSLQIKFIYPVNFPDKEILNLLQKQFIADYFGAEYAGLTPGKAAEKYTGDYINTFKEGEKDFLADQKNHESEPNESWYASDETATNQIVYNRNHLLSVVTYKESYTGGAHGAHSYINRVIDLKTGRQITESDIFIEDYQDDLAKIIVDGIALSNNVDNAEDLEKTGFFSINEIYPNKNFYVDETGITYTYNEYDIAAYVVGAVSVQIPYEMIRHLLRVDSPVSAIAF